MRKCVSIIAAAFAALTITTTAGAEYLTYEPGYSITAESNADYHAQEDGEIITVTDEQPEAAVEEKTYTALDILKMAGISVLAGLVIALIVCLIMKSFMKTANSKHTANDYIKKNSFHITRSRDIFIYAELSKRKRVKEENKK